MNVLWFIINKDDRHDQHMLSLILSVALITVFVVAAAGMAVFATVAKGGF